MSIKACELMVEAHKNYTKYEGKKYKGLPIRDGASRDYSELYVHNGRLFVGDGLWAYVHSDTELEEIKPEPVTFMEAVKAYRAGKTIRCERESKFNTTTYCSGSDLIDRENHRPINPDEILNGTWYIEE